jgi:hypothetical protein
LNKIFTISTLLAVILAIVSPFVQIPYSAAGLLILGGIGAINNPPDLRLRIYAATVILILGGKSLTNIPMIGDPLAAIFVGVALALTGASIVGVSLGIYQLLKTNLTK